MPSQGGRSVRARELWGLLEPIHAVIYFAPEAAEAFKEAGYRGFWMGYFAGRAAPLGEATPELVQALFYNFTAEHVARALPDAWQFAPPKAALGARLDGAVAALARHWGEPEAPGVRRAADLALRAATGAPIEGRSLAAANRSLPIPDEPLAALWHAATLLREHRGDGHVVALTAAGINGREAHVLHSLYAAIPAEVYAFARRLEDSEWADIVARLRSRGLIDATGMLTSEGRALKQSIEDLTDDLAAPAYDVLGDAEVDELTALLRPLATAVVRAGDIPVKTPIGIDLSDLVSE